MRFNSLLHILLNDVLCALYSTSFAWMNAPSNINIFFLIGLFKLCKIGEDKNLSVMTSVELKKLFPGKKVET